MQILSMFKKTKSRYLLIAIMSFLLLLLVVSPFSNPVQQLIQQDNLIEKNEAYLESIAKSDRKVLIQLAEIEALLAVLKSGEVGISFIVDLHVKVGKSLTTFANVIDSSLEATITAIIATTALEIILQLCEYLSDWIFLSLLLCTFLLCCHRLLFDFKPNSARLEKTLLETLAILFLSVHVLVPYSIHGASFIDKTLFFDQATQKKKNLEDLHGTLISGAKNVDLNNKAKTDFKKYETVAVDITQKIENTLNYHIEHFLHIIFRAFIIPLGIFMLLFYCLQHFLLPKFRELLHELLAYEIDETKVVNEIKDSSQLVEQALSKSLSHASRRRNQRRSRQ